MPDALTDILESVRMEGSVFSRAALAAPYGVESGRLQSGVFHAVVAGQTVASLAGGGPPVHLGAGDVVVFPFGDNHLITDAPGREHRPIVELTTVDSEGMGHLIVDGGGPATSLICGTIAFESGDAHPVFSLLPRMVVVRDPGDRSQKVVHTLIELIAEEVDNPDAGSQTVVGRLTDVLIVHVLRSYISQLDPGEGGWLGALNDPSLREAIGLIHHNPGRPWTVDELARAAGMSRSSFYVRFREVVGETPGKYLARWRMQVATRLLREGRSIAAAGREVGYVTEAAFSNAFLRVMGIRPGAYRRAA